MEQSPQISHCLRLVLKYSYPNARQFPYIFHSTIFRKQSNLGTRCPRAVTGSHAKEEEPRVRIDRSFRGTFTIARKLPARRTGRDFFARKFTSRHFYDP